VSGADRQWLAGSGAVVGTVAVPEVRPDDLACCLEKERSDAAAAGVAAGAPVDRDPRGRLSGPPRRQVPVQQRGRMKPPVRPVGDEGRPAPGR
jgi:hypothetical protein